MTLSNSFDRQEPVIQVLVANMSGVLAELVEKLIRQQPDMKLVGPVQGQLEVLAAVGPETDVVLLGAEDVYPPPGICSHLLSEIPHLKILVLANHDDTAIAYWLGLQHHQIRMISTETLIKNIRQIYKLHSV